MAQAVFDWIEIPAHLQDPDSLHQDAHLSFLSLIASVAVNVVIAILGACFFLAFRSTDAGFRYLTPRRFVWPESIDQETTESLLAKPTSLVDWAVRLWQWNEPALIKGAGFDSVVLFRVLRCRCRILAV